MPVKILLADKSITIQKVVEMLFSGRNYEVVCVSDGETALNEAARVVPDVVLVDVDLPRIDGYSFAARLKQIPQFAQTPVILMMSRDDVYNDAQGKQAGIIDNIAKPFESQDLIGKVKKALSGTPQRAAQPAQPAAPPPPAATARPKQAAPADIFDIISEAPTQADLARAAAPVEEEAVYEVEPVVEEVEEPLARDMAKELPIGAKAVEEMRAGLGLSGEKKEPQPEAATFESIDAAFEADRQPASSPPYPRPVPLAVQAPALPEADLRKMAEEAMAKMAKDVFANLPPVQPPKISDETLRAMVEEKISGMADEFFKKMPAPQPPSLSASDVWSIAEEMVAKMAKDVFANLPPVQPPQISDETLRAMVEEKVSNMTREVLEKTPVAIPSAFSPSDMWSVAEEAVEKIAKEFFQNQPSAQTPQLSDESLRSMVEEVAAKTVKETLEKSPLSQPTQIPESELRSMADEAVARVAADVFKTMPAPTIAKMSDDSVRQEMEETVRRIAQELSRETIERVAWEVIPQLAEQLITAEIERLKAME